MVHSGRSGMAQRGHTGRDQVGRMTENTPQPPNPYQEPSSQAAMWSPEPGGRVPPGAGLPAAGGPMGGLPPGQPTPPGGPPMGAPPPGWLPPTVPSPGGLPPGGPPFVGDVDPGGPAPGRRRPWARG